LQQTVTYLQIWWNKIIFILVILNIKQVNTFGINKIGMTGKIISHYKITGKIGEGGMGIVYKAQDTRLRRDVALKFLPPELTRDQDAKKRFLREAQTISSIDHPNICTVYEIDETEEGQLFIAMACYKGKTLKEKLEEGPIKVEEAIKIAADIARGLERAHGQGIIHRDIKPANIFITDDGIVKILDFGLAKLASQSSLTRTGSTPGTAFYMSPEQLKGEKADSRTDIWSLGVVLYEMVTGRPPFRGEYEQAVIYSILNKKPEKLRSVIGDIPSDIERIIDRSLQKEVSKRYRDIMQLENDLNLVKQKIHIHSPKSRIQSLASSKIIKISSLIVLPAIIILLYFILKPAIFRKEAIERPLTIAVISFENQTGNSAYDYLQNAIPNLLITSLEQSPQLQVTTWERLYDLLRQLGKENISSIDRNTGFELCGIEGIDAIVLGSFVKTGDVFATEIKILDVATKRIIKSARSQGTGIESILKNQIDQLSGQISSGILYSKKDNELPHIKITDVTTSSIEAYNYFVRGRDEYFRGTGEAPKYLKKAIKIDTTFATAYLWLGRTLIIDMAEKNEYLMKARQYSHKATRKEQLYIEAELEPDYNKKSILYNRIIKEFPKEKYPHYILGESHRYNKDFKNALEEYMKALDLDPYFTPATASLCYLYAETGNNKKTEEFLSLLAASNPGDALPIMTVANIYFIDGKLDEALEKYNEASEIDPDAMSEVYASVIYTIKMDFDKAFESINRYMAIDYPSYRNPGGRGWRCHLYYLTGQYRNAISDIVYSNDKFKEWNNLYFLGLCEALLGSIYYEKEDYVNSRYHYNRFREVLGGKDRLQVSYIVNFTCEPLLGLVDIRQGYYDSAQIRLINKDEILSHVHVNNKEVSEMQYRLLEAELLLAKDSIDSAISIGEKIKELAPPRYFPAADRLIFYNLPWSRDILARAYIKKGSIDKAIGEYERLIRFNPASKDRRIMNPKYHYYLGRLYQEKDQKNKAIQHFIQFLGIWKSADKDIPELIDAKKRLRLLANENDK
jgi:serine/threonine protein kinase